MFLFGCGVNDSGFIDLRTSVGRRDFCTEEVVDGWEERGKS